MEIGRRGKNLIITAGMMILASGLSVCFRRMNMQEHIVTIFVFAVFLVSLLTEGYLYGIVSAIVGTLVVNYTFTFPYYAFNFVILENLFSAIIMVTIAILTGMLTTKSKQHEVLKTEKEKESMRANLLRAISHDLRTPLTTIYTASSVLRDKRRTLTDEQQDVMLHNIQEDAEWLIRMVENLLSITRIDGGKIKITKMSVILEELIDSAMTKFLKRFPNQEVELDIPHEPIVILADPFLIEQVMANLMENAVLHAQGMTTLILRVFLQENQAIVEIIDDGCGIGEDLLKQIFTKCNTGQKDSSDGRKRNAGIGLSVCATIIKAHGGEICAENRKEGGALFRFSLETEGIADDK